MDIVNDYLMHGPRHPDPIRNRRAMVCKDGFTMSVQASDFHYCSPRKNEAYPYTAVEVGFPSQSHALLTPYAEDSANLTDTVYGNVPVSVVEQVITDHGGLANFTATEE